MKYNYRLRVSRLLQTTIFSASGYLHRSGGRKVVVETSKFYKFVDLDQLALNSSSGLRSGPTKSVRL